MGFWKKLLPVRNAGPSPEALAQLEKSKVRLAEVESRETRVVRMSAWLDQRREQNHFGDDLDITFVRKKPRHA